MSRIVTCVRCNTWPTFQADRVCSRCRNKDKKADKPSEVER